MTAIASPPIPARPYPARRAPKGSVLRNLVTTTDHKTRRVTGTYRKPATEVSAVSELVDETLELACVDCGAVCKPLPMLVYGMDRCPECHVDEAKREAYRAFGTHRTTEALLTGPTHEPRESPRSRLSRRPASIRRPFLAVFDSDGHG